MFGSVKWVFFDSVLLYIIEDEKYDVVIVDEVVLIFFLDVYWIIVNYK